MKMTPKEKKIWRGYRANMSDKEKEEELKNHWAYFSPEEIKECWRETYEEIMNEKKI